MPSSFPNLNPKPATEHSLLWASKLAVILSAIALLAGLVLSSWAILILAATLFMLGSSLFFVRYATLASGHWHEIHRKGDGRFLRYVHKKDAGAVPLWPWENIELNPFWIDQSIIINLKDIQDVMTHDDLPFQLRGKLMLRLIPELIAPDVRSAYAHYIRLDEELREHVLIMVANTVNNALLELGTQVASAREFEARMRSSDFRNNLSQSILQQFTPSIQVEERSENKYFVPNGLGLINEISYIRGGFGDGILRPRQQLSGGAMGARLAQELEASEDITLEDIALTSGATQSYMRLRGSVSTDRRSRQTNRDTQQQVESTPVEKPKVQVPSEPAKDEPPQENDPKMDERIKRLSSMSPADIIRERRKRDNLSQNNEGDLL